MGHKPEEYSRKRADPFAINIILRSVHATFAASRSASSMSIFLIVEAVVGTNVPIFASLSKKEKSDIPTKRSVLPSVDTSKNYINGKWVSTLSGDTLPVYDPSTEVEIARAASSGPADVDLAVQAARAAFDSGPWGTTTAQDRGRVLFKLAEKIRQNSENPQDRMPQFGEADRRSRI